eukprot:jgi/Psemu1/5208/gm1.5208_g
MAQSISMRWKFPLKQHITSSAKKMLKLDSFFYGNGTKQTKVHEIEMAFFRTPAAAFVAVPCFDPEALALWEDILASYSTQGLCCFVQ